MPMSSSATTTKEKEESAALGFGSQGQKKQKEKVQFNETQISTRINETRFHLSIRTPEQKSPLYEKYGASRYNLHPDYTFSESLQSLIPRNTPEFVDRGEKYVERIIRALYYFKQCALIGPSGTGKTHIVYMVAEIGSLPMYEINCGLQASTYDLFGKYKG